MELLIMLPDSGIVSFLPNGGSCAATYCGRNPKPEIM
jgi:hypothetical protein